MEDQTTTPVEGAETLPDAAPPAPDDASATSPTTVPGAAPESIGDPSLGDRGDADASTGKDSPKDVAEPLSGRVRAPADTRGVYVVLMARKPRRGDHSRPAYVEVGFYPAANVQKAKEAASADPRVSDYLRRSAAQKPGILLRAVPAMHWPDTIEATTIEPNPQMVIR